MGYNLTAYTVLCRVDAEFLMQQPPHMMHYADHPATSATRNDIN